MHLGSTESVWARGWRDTKSGWSDWRFWVCEFFVGGGIAMIDPVIGLAFVAAIASGVWICATATAPYRIIRDERELRLAAENELVEVRRRGESLKSKIRGVLEDANPQILKAIDGGAGEMYVKLRPQRADALNDLAEKRQAREYFACFAQHGLVDMGVGNLCRKDIPPIEDIGSGQSYVHFSWVPAELLRNN